MWVPTVALTVNGVHVVEAALEHRCGHHEFTGSNVVTAGGGGAQDVFTLVQHAIGHVTHVAVNEEPNGHVTLKAAGRGHHRVAQAAVFLAELDDALDGVRSSHVKVNQLVAGVMSGLDLNGGAVVAGFGGVPDAGGLLQDYR